MLQLNRPVSVSFFLADRLELDQSQQVDTLEMAQKIGKSPSSSLHFSRNYHFTDVFLPDSSLGQCNLGGVTENGPSNQQRLHLRVWKASANSLPNIQYCSLRSHFVDISSEH